MSRDGLIVHVALLWRQRMSTLAIAWKIGVREWEVYNVLDAAKARLKAGK